YGPVVNIGIHGRGHGIDSVPQDALQFLVYVVGFRIELAHVGAVDDVEVGVFTGADGELPHLAGGVFLADEQGSAGAEVGVGAVLAGLVVHFEVVGDGESTLGGEVEEGVAIVGGHAGAGVPDGALVAVGSYVEHGGLRQGAGVVAHDPSGVGTKVAVRGPAEVNRAVDEEKAGTLFILGGVENHEATCAVVPGAGILGGDVDGAVKEFCASGGVEGVQALVIVAGAIFRHGDDVDDGVAGLGARDDGS